MLLQPRDPAGLGHRQQLHGRHLPDRRVDRSGRAVAGLVEAADRHARNSPLDLVAQIPVVDPHPGGQNLAGYQRPVLGQRVFHLFESERQPWPRQDDGGVVGEVGWRLVGDIAIDGPQAQLRVQPQAQVRRQPRPLDRTHEPVFGIAGASLRQRGDAHEDLGRPMPTEQPLHLLDRAGPPAAIGERYRPHDSLGERAHRQRHPEAVTSEVAPGAPRRRRPRGQSRRGAQGGRTAQECSAARCHRAVVRAAHLLLRRFTGWCLHCAAGMPTAARRCRIPYAHISRWLVRQQGLPLADATLVSASPRLHGPGQSSPSGKMPVPLPPGSWSATGMMLAILLIRVLNGAPPESG